MIQACNDSGLEPADGGDPFGEYTDCDGDLALGLIVGNNLYDAVPAEGKYVRFDPTSDGGRGKSKATDITRLFTYTGWIVSETLDANLDGIIDINDVPLGDYDGDGSTDPNRDFNNDGFEKELDVEEWLMSLEEVSAWYYDKEWILRVYFIPVPY